MDHHVISREEIAEHASQDARAWLESGCKGAIQQRYAALSQEAKLYDVAFRRALNSDDEESGA